jgi:hypothetical protein
MEERNQIANSVDSLLDEQVQVVAGGDGAADGTAVADGSDLSSSSNSGGTEAGGGGERLVQSLGVGGVDVGWDQLFDDPEGSSVTVSPVRQPKRIGATGTAAVETGEEGGPLVAGATAQGGVAATVRRPLCSLALIAFLCPCPCLCACLCSCS